MNAVYAVALDTYTDFLDSIGALRRLPAPAEPPARGEKE